MKLEMRKINKSFGPVQVLFDVDFYVEKNEIHALIGENGAGKSTLMKILSGIYSFDSGEIYINDELCHIRNIQDSESRKIAIVNQELNVFGHMTVLENLFIGKEISRNGVINETEEKKVADGIFKRLGIELDYNLKVKELSVGMQQMLEIGKSLVNDAELIIMDEPTSALTEKEIEALFDVIRRLKADGKSIVYISHRMKEIFELCDSITILRDGKLVKREQISKVTFDDVVKSMVGYELGGLFPQRPVVKLGPILLEVRNLSRDRKFNDISFELHEGEIIGFAGLMGAGRTEIMNVLFGADKSDGGEIFINSEKVSINSVPQAKALGIGYVTENRKEEGLFLDFSINENVLFNNLNRLSKNFIINDKKAKALTNDYSNRVRLKCRDYQQLVNELSGGNQQKVVLSKWLANNPAILILDEPTRGIDVNAKKQIYEMIFELKKAKIGIIVVSSELVELLGIADKIYVMREGHLMASLVNDHLTDELVMNYMMGGTDTYHDESRN